MSFSSWGQGHGGMGTSGPSRDSLVVADGFQSKQRSFRKPTLKGFIVLLLLTLLPTSAALDHGHSSQHRQILNEDQPQHIGKVDQPLDKHPEDVRSDNGHNINYRSSHDTEGYVNKIQLPQLNKYGNDLSNLVNLFYHHSGPTNVGESEQTGLRSNGYFHKDQTDTLKHIPRVNVKSKKHNIHINPSTRRTGYAHRSHNHQHTPNTHGHQGTSNGGAHTKVVVVDGRHTSSFIENAHQTLSNLWSHLLRKVATHSLSREVNRNTSGDIHTGDNGVPARYSFDDRTGIRDGDSPRHTLLPDQRHTPPSASYAYEHNSLDQGQHGDLDIDNHAPSTTMGHDVTLERDRTAHHHGKFPEGHRTAHYDVTNMDYGLCIAQCQARCLEVKSNCSASCQDLQFLPDNEVPTWEAYCPNNPHQFVAYGENNCVGSCSIYPDSKGSQYIPSKPPIVISRDPGNKFISLSWSHDTETDVTTVYVIAKQLARDTDWMVLGWVNNDLYFRDTSDPDLCSSPYYQVASVSASGSRWFGEEIITPALLPGPPRDIRLTILDYTPTQRKADSIDFTLEWRPPIGWLTSDIEVQHNVTFDYKCQGHTDKMYMFVSSIFLKHGNNFTADDFYVLNGNIPTDAIGCDVWFWISAISKCGSGLQGAPNELNISLSCDKFPNYRLCQLSHGPPRIVPGPVSDVHVTVVPYHGHHLALVSWQPPVKLGSSDHVDKYHLFWGTIDNTQQLIMGMSSVLGHVTVPGEILEKELFVNITKLTPFETIGVTVRAAAPYQHIDSPFGEITTPLPFAKTTTLLQKGDVYVTEVDDKASPDDTVQVQVYWRPLDYFLPGMRKAESRDTASQAPPTTFGIVWGHVTRRPDNLTSIAMTSTTGGPGTLDQVNDTLTTQPTKYYVFWGLADDSSRKLNLAFADVRGQEDVPLFSNFVTLKLKHNTTYGCMIFPISNSSGFKVTTAMTSMLHDTNHLLVFTTHLDNITEDEGNPHIPDPSVHVTVATRQPLTDISPSSIPLLAIPLAVVVAIVVVIVAVVYIRRCRETKLALQFNNTDRGEDRPYSIFTTGRSLADSERDRCPPLADGWELPLTCVKLGETLGAGAFGQVVKGLVSRAMLTHRGVMTSYIESEDGGDALLTTVAVKMLQDFSDSRLRHEFLREIQLMKRLGCNPHVVSMLGCCTLRDPLCLVVEHCSRGDLLKYLKDVRQLMCQDTRQQYNYANGAVDIIQPTDLLEFALQIAKGMTFLSDKGFVHRDLAARNVLIAADKTCKIGDFGLARYVYNDAVYVNRKGGRLPVKWMSVEAIFDCSFSTASDVWSFGVVLYEIVTLGGTPYPTVATQDMLGRLRAGYRMGQPDNCSLGLYDMMRQCWQESPGRRPSFSGLVTWLAAMMDDVTGEQYIDLRLNLQQPLYKVPNESRPEYQDMQGFNNVTRGDLDREPLDVRGLQSCSKREKPDAQTGDNFQTRRSGLASEDSGYTSQQKSSVSSYETDPSPRPMPRSLSCILDTDLDTDLDTEKVSVMTGNKSVRFSRHESIIPRSAKIQAFGGPHRSDVAANESQNGEAKLSKRRKSRFDSEASTCSDEVFHDGSFDEDRVNLFMKKATLVHSISASNISSSPRTSESSSDDDIEVLDDFLFTRRRHSDGDILDWQKHRDRNRSDGSTCPLFLAESPPLSANEHFGFFNSCIPKKVKHKDKGRYVLNTLAFENTLYYTVDNTPDTVENYGTKKIRNAQYKKEMETDKKDAETSHSPFLLNVKDIIIKSLSADSATGRIVHKLNKTFDNKKCSEMHSKILREEQRHKIHDDTSVQQGISASVSEKHPRSFRKIKPDVDFSITN